MGQKIHPLGFRVGITKKHQSQWFARFHKYQYSQAILEDHILRQTLLDLFPKLVNPVLKKGKKPDQNQNESLQITHIKIERALIPYEIGIQIHAGNCKLIKSAIDNLQINQKLISNLQKTRRYLTDLSQNYLVDLKMKLKELVKSEKNSISKRTRKFKIRGNKSLKTSDMNLSTLGQKLDLQIQQIAEKRAKKRQAIRRRFFQRVLKNRMILKNAKTITRKQKIETTNAIKEGSSIRTTIRGRSGIQNQNRSKNTEIKTQKTNMSIVGMNKQNLTNSSSTKTKFVSTFLNKMNKNFLKNLKQQMKYWNEYMLIYRKEQIQKYGVLKYATLGYNRKWSLSRLNKLQNQPLSLLKKLVKFLQAKSLKKMEILRQEFLAIGSLSKTQTFSYYQMNTFIKNLKLLVKKLTKEKIQSKKLLKQKSKTTSSSFNQKNKSKVQNQESILKKIALINKFNNIDAECRKIKFIEYLKDVVKQHRTKNIYFYLATIADSRKSLKKIKQFNKQNANFLFGINQLSLQNTDSKAYSKIQNRVKTVILQSTQISESDKGLQEVFLQQLPRQTAMYKQNIALTPKIKIKFYSVKSQNLESKASIVADSIIDDLEKRKAFRGVIKKTKEKLMENSSVKGVKIRVSGRLNGAEIARSEWVKSGRIPLQTLRANIDYCYKTANTIYGIIGVKVWIYKGYAKVRRLNVNNTVLVNN